MIKVLLLLEFIGVLVVAIGFASQRTFAGIAIGIALPAAFVWAYRRLE